MSVEAHLGPYRSSLGLSLPPSYNKNITGDQECEQDEKVDEADGGIKMACPLHAVQHEGQPIAHRKQEQYLDSHGLDLPEVVKDGLAVVDVAP